MRFTVPLRISHQSDTPQSLDHVEVRGCPLVGISHLSIATSPIYSYKRVRPGDVGYTRRGRSHLLFSAGLPLGSRELGVDVSTTFESLDVGSVISDQTRPPGYLRTESVQQIVWMLAVPGLLLGVYAGFGPVINHQLIERASPVEPGAGIAFELTSKRGAALITKHPTYWCRLDSGVCNNCVLKQPCLREVRVSCNGPCRRVCFRGRVAGIMENWGAGTHKLWPTPCPCYHGRTDLERGFRVGTCNPG